MERRRVGDHPLKKINHFDGNFPFYNWMSLRYLDDVNTARKYNFQTSAAHGVEQKLPNGLKGCGSAVIFSSHSSEQEKPKGSLRKHNHNTHPAGSH